VTDIEKVLTEVREALVDCRKMLALVQPAMKRKEAAEHLMTLKCSADAALAAFTADMPGAIGECVEVLGWPSIRDQIPLTTRISLAKLEGK